MVVITIITIIIIIIANLDITAAICDEILSFYQQYCIYKWTKEKKTIKKGNKQIKQKYTKALD